MRDATCISLCAFLAFFVAADFGPSALGQGSNQKNVRPIPFYGEGYVLLQHGNVLHGFVQPHADRISIRFDKGNEVSVPNRQVLTVGKSMESLYDFQAKAIRKWGTGEHWHMAQWCIQNGLLDQAIEHYTELEKTAPQSSKFKQLDLQLRQALLADAKVQEALEQQGIPNPNTPVEAIPAVNPIAPANFEQPAHGSLSMNSDAEPSSGRAPSRIVPGYLRRGFQTDVQPIVVSRCGQSGCHGMLSKNEFQIFQPVGEQAASISQRNLDALMVHVDHADPLQTSLMQYAVRPHGSQRNPSIHPNREEDRVLLEKIGRWLQSVAEAESSSNQSHLILGGSMAPSTEPARVSPAMALIPKSAVQNAMRRKPMEDFPEQDRNAKLSKPPKSAPPAVVLDASEIKAIEDAISELEEKHRENGSARNPLDPAVFNAKYAGEKSGESRK
jgi:hypothetical protein